MDEKKAPEAQSRLRTTQDVAAESAERAGRSSDAGIGERFCATVLDAKDLLEFAVGQGYTKEDGRKIDDRLIEQIVRAEDLLREGGIPSSDDRASFEKAYRDLSLFVAPVTAQTLRATSDKHGRRTLLTPRIPRAEATIWSRKLTTWTIMFVVVAVFGDLLTDLSGQFLPPVDETRGGGIPSVHYLRTLLGILVPFTYGGIGACVYLLRSCHQYIYTRQFDPNRISEYYNRMLLGMVSGGAVTLFVSQIPDEKGAVVRLSGAALGFLAGYNTDFLFSAVERIAAAILPKVGVETVRQAQPRSADLSLSVEGVSLKDILDRFDQAESDEKRKLYQDLIDRLKEKL
jgi:hypothetical protein